MKNCFGHPIFFLGMQFFLGMLNLFSGMQFLFSDMRKIVQMYDLMEPQSQLIRSIDKDRKIKFTRKKV
jgi:hypothetical protein